MQIMQLLALLGSIWWVPIIVVSVAGEKLGIRKDIVSIENGTVSGVEQTVLYDSMNNYVELLPNSPLPKQKANKKSQVSGRGVLYHIEDSFDCVPRQREAGYFGNNFVRIAAINYHPNSNGNDNGNKKCSAHAYLEQAILDGSKGALIYSDSYSVADLKTTLFKDLKGGFIRIPVYIIDYPVGDFLKSQLSQIDAENEKNKSASGSSKYKKIYISLMAENRNSPGLWKTIFLLLLLVMSLYACYKVYKYCKVRRNSYSKFEEIQPNSLSVIKRRTLTTADLKHLRTERVEASNGSNSSSIGGMCSMCIDDFTDGCKLRVLPCKHRFHASCIDPWLLEQSALCPMCKFDTRKALFHNPSYNHSSNQNHDHSSSSDFISVALGDQNNKHSNGARGHSFASLDGRHQKSAGVFGKIKQSVTKIKTTVLSGNSTNKQSAQNDRLFMYPRRSVSFEKPKFQKSKNKRSIKVLQPDQAVPISSPQLASADFTFLTQSQSQNQGQNHSNTQKNTQNSNYSHNYKL